MKTYPQGDKEQLPEVGDRSKGGCPQKKTKTEQHLVQDCPPLLRLVGHTCPAYCPATGLPAQVQTAGLQLKQTRLTSHP